LSRLVLIGLTLLISAEGSAQERPLTCLRLEYTPRHGGFPEFIVLYPGADSGLVAVAASASRELRPTSSLRRAAYWRISRGSVSFTLGDGMVSQRFQMAQAGVISGRAVLRMPLRDLDTDSIVAWRSDSLQVRAQQLLCSALPRGLPDTSTLLRPRPLEPVTHVRWRGIYSYAFEERLFHPCRDQEGADVMLATARPEFGPVWADRSTTAWVAPNVGRWRAPDSTGRAGGFVEWSGELRGPGSFGHGGIASYLLRVDSVFAVDSLRTCA